MNHSPKSSRYEALQPIAEEQLLEHRPIGRVFESPEDLIRFDVRHTPPPPAIAARLQESLAAAAVQPTEKSIPWWRRLFRRPARLADG